MILTSSSSHFGQTLVVMEAPIDRSIDRSGCCEQSAHFLTQKGLWIVWVWLSREGGSSGSLLLLYWSVVTQKPHTGQMIDWTIHSVLTDCVSSPPSVFPLVFLFVFPSSSLPHRHKPPKNRRICSHTFIFIGSSSDNLSEDRKPAAASAATFCPQTSRHVFSWDRELCRLFHRVQRSVDLLSPERNCSFYIKQLQTSVSWTEVKSTDVNQRDAKSWSEDNSRESRRKTRKVKRKKQFWQKYQLLLLPDTFCRITHNPQPRGSEITSNSSSLTDDTTCKLVRRWYEGVLRGVGVCSNAWIYLCLYVYMSVIKKN